MTARYRIERIHGCGWVLIRNHDDEPMAVYDTKKEAEDALNDGKEGKHANPPPVRCDQHAEDPREKTESRAGLQPFERDADREGARP